MLLTQMIGRKKGQVLGHIDFWVFLSPLLPAVLNGLVKVITCPCRDFLAYSTCGCYVLLWFLHFLVSEELSSHCEIYQVTWRGGMTDHRLHGAGSRYVLCGHHDTCHACAARLLEASRGPVFPTALPLCYGKAQKQGLFITYFN